MEVSGAQAAYRVLDLLSEIAAHPDGLTATEAAGALKISVPTAHRLLKVLCDRGFVRLGVEHKRYVKAAQYGFVTTGTDPDMLVERAIPILERLRESSDETVFLSHRQGLSVRYLVCLPSRRAVRLSGTPGMSVPLHASSQGKVILAFSAPSVRERLLRSLDMTSFTQRTLTDRVQLEAALETVRSQGFATNIEEHEVGTHSVSVPVLDGYGNAIAAICIGGPKFRVEVAHLVEPLAPLAQAAARALAAVVL